MRMVGSFFWTPKISIGLNVVLGIVASKLEDILQNCNIR